MRLPAVSPTFLLIGLAVGGVALFVWSKGGLSQAASSAGRAVVEGAGSVAKGGIDAVSEQVGIPSTEETTTDPAVARWLIDKAGYWEASFWCGVPALVAAVSLPAGSGRPPPAGSAIARQFGTAPVVYVPPAEHTEDPIFSDPMTGFGY